MKLRPVRFHWKDKKMDAQKGEQLGFIAQEMEKVFPETISAPTDVTYDAGQGKQTVKNAKTMSYAEMVVPLVKAVQEMKALFDGLLAKVEKLAANVETLIARMVDHDAAIARLQAANDNQARALEDLHQEFRGYKASHP